jgi:long-subunit fatty acid transport protein
MSAPFYPSENATFGNLHVGNVHDDDPGIIDADVLEVDKPPTPITESITTPTLRQPKDCTRLLTTTLDVDPTWDKAVLLMPADANRIGLVLRVTSATAVATDYVMVADDAGKLEANSSAGKLYHGQSLDLGSGDGSHTGPLYVRSRGASAITSIASFATTS